MSVPPGAGPRGRPERWLTFEVAGQAFGLPIGDVVEVAEVGRIAAVPTLPRAVGGVMHYHGDALPVVSRAALFDVQEDGEPEHVVVIAGDADTARLGVPVDRVMGLVDGESPATREPGLVAQRRPIDGRIHSILDTERLVERAAVAIERSAEAGRQSGDPENGGES